MKLLFACLLAGFFAAANADTWTASSSNVQSGWVWWFSGQGHYTYAETTSTPIPLPGVTSITSVNMSEPCLPASYSIVGEAIQFSFISSGCAVQTIEYLSGGSSSGGSSGGSSSGGSSSGGSGGDTLYPGFRITETIGTPLDIGQGDFSVSFRIRTTTSDITASCLTDNINNGNMILDRDRLNAPRSIVISVINGSIGFRLDNEAVCGTQTVDDGVFHDVTVSRIGSTATITVDNVDYTQTVSTSDISCQSESTTGDCDITIGYEKWGFMSANPFYGDLEAFQIISNGVEVL